MSCIDVSNLDLFELGKENRILAAQLAAQSPLQTFELLTFRYSSRIPQCLALVAWTEWILQEILTQWLGDTAQSVDVFEGTCLGPFQQPVLTWLYFCRKSLPTRLNGVCYAYFLPSQHVHRSSRCRAWVSANIFSCSIIKQCFPKL